MINLTISTPFAWLLQMICIQNYFLKSTRIWTHYLPNIRLTSFSSIGMWPFLIQFVISVHGCDYPCKQLCLHPLPPSAAPSASSGLKEPQRKALWQSQDCCGGFSTIKAQPKANLLKVFHWGGGASLRCRLSSDPRNLFKRNQIYQTLQTLSTGSVNS